MSIWEPYENTTKRIKLQHAFAHIGRWAETKAVVAAARGEKTDEAEWAMTRSSAQILKGVADGKNIVGQFYNNMSLRGPFSHVIERLNAIAQLPPDHPDRVDPSLRASARRIGQFRKTLDDRLDCTGRLGLPGWTLKH